MLDFTDLEHKALTILKDESGRVAVRNRYQRIFVDECQDVSSVQDALIQELAGDKNTLFMVGDVKQSIYRFRLANRSCFYPGLRIRDRMPGNGYFFRKISVHVRKCLKRPIRSFAMQCGRKQPEWIIRRRMN